MSQLFLQPYLFFIHFRVRQIPQKYSLADFQCIVMYVQCKDFYQLPMECPHDTLGHATFVLSAGKSKFQEVEQELLSHDLAGNCILVNLPTQVNHSSCA